MKSQCYRDPNNAIDNGYRKTFQNQNKTLSINDPDLLYSLRFRTVTSGDGFWQDSENWRGGRRVGFTLTYNFGNMGKRKPQAPNRPMGGEDGPGMFEMD